MELVGNRIEMRNYGSKGEGGGRRMDVNYGRSNGR